MRTIVNCESEFTCDGQLIVALLMNDIKLLYVPLFYDTFAVKWICQDKLVRFPLISGIENKEDLVDVIGL